MTPEEEKSQAKEALRQSMQEYEMVTAQYLAALKSSTDKLQTDLLDAMGHPDLPKGIEPTLINIADIIPRQSRLHALAYQQCHKLNVENIQLKADIMRLQSAANIHRQIIERYILKHGPLTPDDILSK
ncbi:hypothetical protein [Pontibacter pamirensis]|uniref:hypothetical protein n=1 Tax=Pontibacter pamirensis TaxID=2562824 RepID=UPI001389CBF1|nr:hypothetical protein [Pontibacter pamirensis]